MISDYGTLKIDLQKYLQDTDLDSEIPDFVQLCTERLNTDLEAFGLEKEATLDVTTGEAAVPEDFGQILSIRMDVYPNPPQYTTPQAFHEYPNWDAETRQPAVYTIEAQTLKFCPTPDQTANAIIVYRNKLALLVNDTDTNTILEKNSGLYLYGSLLAAEPRVGNDPRMATWGVLYQERLDAVNKETRADRFPRGAIKATMSVRPSRLGRPRTAQCS